jgi:hypothetical protein
MSKFSTKNTKLITIENIFELITDYDIFKYYIKDNIIFGKAISSPLRKDNSPSFSIYKKNDKIMFSDFGNGDYGSSIDFVKLKFNVSFKEALLIINTDFNLKLAEPFLKPSMNYYGIHNKSFNISNINSEIKNIDITIRNYNLNDKLYWFDKYNIGVTLLKKYKVIPIKQLFMNGKLVKNYSKSNPMYGYYFGNGKWKIYSPYDTNFKWLSNCSELQGFRQLKRKSKILVIQKSLKDVMVMSMLGYNSFALHAESVIIDNNLVEKLKRRFKKIYIFYDFDKAGIEATIKTVKDFKFNTIHLNNGNLGPYDWKAKDISDFIELYGIKKTKEFLNKRIK